MSLLNAAVKTFALS